MNFDLTYELRPDLQNLADVCNCILPHRLGMYASLYSISMGPFSYAFSHTE